jgi:eukaryotic-like serine/threonine-protein kinase
MTPERWLEVERLFHEASERPPHERAAFLQESSAGDDALRREVESLLDQSSRADAFLEGPAVGAAALLDGQRRSTLIGRRLSEYEVQEWIGAGGMGEVYRARDVKLGRDVAIKMLPAFLASDPGRAERFKREARILATLNHPHIGAIYALEESDGILGLVLELVEGPTLADRLNAGPLPIPDALVMARQTADALEAAHAKGIIHRDLKPANIKVAQNGTVKVLDFGLAKAAAARTDVNLTGRPTVELTAEGVVLGTASYMSPEQARGLAVDSRTDIWAFGCVLYEALAGRRAFHGETFADCFAAIVGRDPDWSALPSSTPPSIVGLLQRCLDKDVQRRLATIGDARRQLDSAMARRTRTAIVTARVASVARRVPRAAYVGATVVVVVAAGVGVRAVRQMTAKPQQIDIGLATDEFIPPTHSSELALSPDGSLIAYASMKAMAAMPKMNASPNGGATADMNDSMPAMSMSEQIYVRPLGQDHAKPIGGALGSAPFFSPDGKWLGFWHAPTGTLRKVALSGGAPIRICSAVSGIAGGAWGPNDSIVFAWFDLFSVPASGGTPKLLLKVDEQRGERFYRHPFFLPSGKAVLFTVGMADNYSYDDANIGVLSLATGEKKMLIEGGSSARYSPSGHLIYARGGKLLAVAFDPDKLQVIGQPFPVVDGVFMSANTGMAAYAISSDGRLVYAAGPVERGARIPAWVDRKGRAIALPLPPRSYLHPKLSPDERQLAIEVEGASHDIFTYDFARGALTKMSFDGASHWPLWTPDGRRLTYRSWKTGTMTMWWMPADRSGAPELLTNIGSMQSPESWSPNGRTLAFTQMDDPESGSDIYTLSLDGTHTPHALIRTKFSEGSPKFSPDGKWLAYSTNESGRPEVRAMTYPPPGPNLQLSTDGGTDPVWRRDGKELYYRNGEQMMAVAVSSGAATPFARPTVLWEARYLAGVGSSCGMSGPTSANYDVTADGQRFLMIEDKSEVLQCKLLHVVTNWSREILRGARAD